MEQEAGATHQGLEARGRHELRHQVRATVDHVAVGVNHGAQVLETAKAMMQRSADPPKRDTFIQRVSIPRYKTEETTQNVSPPVCRGGLLQPIAAINNAADRRTGRYGPRTRREAHRSNTYLVEHKVLSVLDLIDPVVVAVMSGHRGRRAFEFACFAFLFFQHPRKARQVLPGDIQKSSQSRKDGALGSCDIGVR